MTGCAVDIDLTPERISKCIYDVIHLIAEAEEEVAEVLLDNFVVEEVGVVVTKTVIGWPLTLMVAMLTGCGLLDKTTGVGMVLMAEVTVVIGAFAFDVGICASSGVRGICVVVLTTPLLTIFWLFLLITEPRNSFLSILT